MLRYGLATPDVAITIRRPLKPMPARAVFPWALVLSLCACDDGDTTPPLPGAPGPTDPSAVDAGPPEPVAVRPLVIEAEGGTNGLDVQVVTDTVDPSISYVTAGVNVTTAPVDATDTRIITREVQFPEAGEYQIYARVRIGAGGANDDSFFIENGTDAPNWAVANGLAGFSVLGQPGYQQGAVIGEFGGSSAPGRWMWALVNDVLYTVPEGALTRTVSFATREDGLDIDKLAFALTGDGYTTGFTPDQLDAGEAGVVVFPPVLPDPYEPPADQPPLAQGATKWLGGVCCGNQRPFLENYFNQITPENAGKWGSVEAVRDEFVWTGLDEALAIAQANGFPFRYHVLLWGSQQPDWIEALPPEEQLEEIREWFEAVAERYGQAAAYIEVVNEFENQPPIAENEGNYVEALGGAGESGFDWVLNAFRMAREIFPAGPQLMLNEYSVENNDERTGRYIDLVGLLQAEGLIDAIGIQGHAFSTTGPVEQLVTNINRLGATGLPVIVTELDIDGPELDQLVDFQRIFPAFWENDNVAGITLWGYRDGHWRDAQQATLVYPNGAEKPALRWLKGYMRGTAPVVNGPASAVVASGYAPGTEVGTFVASAPDGAAYPEGTAVAWRVVPVTGGQADASQALSFEADTGRLVLEGATLSAGSYSIRIFADVNATVSNLFDIALTVQ
jgi:endo-1,4-beta-xylanase